MKVYVTYTTIATKEIEVDDKYSVLLDDKTYDIFLAHEMAQDIQFDLDGNLICVEDEKDGNLLVEW